MNNKPCSRNVLKLFSAVELSDVLMKFLWKALAKSYLKQCSGR